MSNNNNIINQLRAPFSPDRIEWRLQSSGEKQDGSVWGRCLAYIDNRAAMERLDEVFGMNWSNKEEFVQIGEQAACVVTISITGEFARSVSGTCAVEANGDIDPFKSAASGAMKRAVVNLGIGRYLYDLPEAWAVIDAKGKYDGKTKNGTRFRWNPPQLPAWAGGGTQSPQTVRTNADYVVDETNAPAEAPAPKTKTVEFRNDFKKETNDVLDSAVKVAIAKPAPGAGYGAEESAMLIPFGKNKGKTLGDLGIDDLKYWATVWEPKPWEKTGKVGPKDMKLKAAANAIYAARTGSAVAKPQPPASLEVPAYEEPTDEIPF